MFKVSDAMQKRTVSSLSQIRKRLDELTPQKNQAGQDDVRDPDQARPGGHIDNNDFLGASMDDLLNPDRQIDEANATKLFKSMQIACELRDFKNKASRVSLRWRQTINM